MKNNTLKNLIKSEQEKKILVVGAAKSGISAQKLLLKMGHSVSFYDDKIPKESPLPFCHQETILNELSSYDLIVLSPGVPRSHAIIQSALQINLLIVNELEIAATLLPNTKFIGITGTNGKSTVAAMLFSILQQNNGNVFLGGNFGNPLSEAVLSRQKIDFAIVELSSYQLETITNISLSSAIITNLAPDHLDRYDNVDCYYQAKAKIFSLLDDDAKIFLNGCDDKSISYFKNRASKSVIWVDHEKINQITKEVDVPDNITGAYNRVNAAMAILCAINSGCSIDNCQEGLKKHRSLPHRMENLGAKNHIIFINDSKATNAAATTTAIKSLPKKAHLIFGGVTKNESYDSLLKAILSHAKAVYVIGEKSAQISKIFDKHITTYDCHTLKNAVLKAYQCADKNDLILLSPACGSFDQFKNFEDRGKCFAAIFNSIT